MSFAAYLDEDRRLAILRILKEAPGYEANASVLQMALGRIGHEIGRQAVRDHIVWLARNGLVAHEVLEEVGIDVATLTEQGLDVATGREVVAGVRRPSPGR